MKIKILIVQHHLMNHLIQTFEREVSVKCTNMMSGVPKFKFQRLMEDINVIDDEYQKKYHSRVRIFLYITSIHDRIFEILFVNFRSLETETLRKYVRCSKS
jgi:hypothetical protein